jgi:hypothetical protein
MTETELGASSASEENLSATTAENQGENTVESPAATGDQPAPSLLEHVQSVIKPKEAEEAPPADAQTEGKGTEEAAATAETEPDDSKLPFHTHPRFKELIGQKNAFRERAEKAEKQIQDFEPVKADAGHYQSIVGYMKQNQLTSEEVNQGFEIMAAIKNDPLRALELLQPHLANLQAFNGGILPADLQAKVESGEVEEATAREFAKSRNVAEFERMKREEMERGQQESRQRQAQQSASDRMTSALLGWENQAKSSDPDWAKKEDMVIAYLRSENSARPPRTEAEAIANANEALKKVNAALAKIVPQRQTTTKTVSSSQSVAGTRPQPKTMQEAVEMAANGNR